MKKLKSAFKPAPKRFAYSVEESVREALLTEPKRSKLNRPARVIIAAVLIAAMIPTSVFAAANLIPLLTKQKGSYGVEVSVDSKTAKASPRYVKLKVDLPKGFKVTPHTEGTQFEKTADSNDDYMSFILIRPDKYNQAELVKDVKSYSKKVINGRETLLLVDNDNFLRLNSRKIITYFDDVNIMLYCYVGADITDEEAQNFIKHTAVVKGTKQNHTDYTSPEDGEQENNEEVFPYSFPEQKYLPLKQGRTVTYGNEYQYTVGDIKVYDKPFDKNLKNYNFEGDDISDHLDKDLNLIPQLNETWIFGDGISTKDKLISSKTEKMKFVTAEITYKNHTKTANDIGINFYIEYLNLKKSEPNESGTLIYPEYIKNANQGKNYYIYKLKPNEERTFTIGFTVYESELDNAYLTIMNEPDNAEAAKYDDNTEITYYTKVTDNG